MVSLLRPAGRPRGEATIQARGLLAGRNERALLAAARKEAGAIKGEIHQKGADPQASLKATRRANATLRAAPKPSTVADLVLASLKTLPLRPATQKEWTRRANVEILKAPFAKKAAADLTSDEVEAWLSKIAERSGHSANSTRTVLLRCYSWAVEKKDRKSTRLNSSHGGISRMPSSA